MVRTTVKYAERPRRLWLSAWLLVLCLLSAPLSSCAAVPPPALTNQDIAGVWEYSPLDSTIKKDGAPGVIELKPEGIAILHNIPIRAVFQEESDAVIDDRGQWELVGRDRGVGTAYVRLQGLEVGISIQLFISHKEDSLQLSIYTGDPDLEIRYVFRKRQ